ncbi:MAG: hypothetical protein AAGI53_17440 [Planctomycetota bacterium]
MRTEWIWNAGLVVVSASAVASGQSATISVNGLSAAGDLGNAGNGVSTGAFSETFVAQSLTWSGQVSSGPNAFFFEEDVFASIEGPNGLGYTGPIAGEQGIFLGTTPFSGWGSGFAPASVNGAWRVEAYTPSTFAGSTNWSLQSTDFAFNADLFPAATSVGVGTSLSAGITEGEIQWYSIDHAGGGLEISTAGSILLELDGAIQTDDTLIALFDGTGTLVEFNDDDPAGGFTSLLSFDDLASGEYRLAVTGSTLGTRVGQNFISTSHDGQGTIQLSIAVPAPGAFASLAAGTLVAIRRRRGT